MRSREHEPRHVSHESHESHERREPPNTSGAGEPRSAQDALDCEVVITRSGEAAMRDRLTGELMHPVVGPRIESAHYVSACRLRERLCEPAAAPSSTGASQPAGAMDPTELVLLDVGLGAGSNAMAAWQLSQSLVAAPRRLRILSFDRSLAALQLALAPEHAPAFGFEGDAHAAARALCVEQRCERPRTSWEYRHGDLLESLAQLPPACADLVLWDPFSPAANPELWGYRAFGLLRRACRAGASVHTYSAATAVRSALLLAGFAVGHALQPAHAPLAQPVSSARSVVHTRKQGTCAVVGLEQLARYGAALDVRFVERLTRSTAAFPADAPADAMARIRALPQLAR